MRPSLFTAPSAAILPRAAALGAGNAGPVTRDRDARNGAREPVVELGGLKVSSLVPIMRAAGGVREIDARHDALVQQQEVAIDASSMLPYIDDAAQPSSPSARSIVTPETTWTARRVRASSFSPLPR